MTITIDEKEVFFHAETNIESFMQDFIRLHAINLEEVMIYHIEPICDYLKLKMIDIEQNIILQKRIENTDNEKIIIDINYKNIFDEVYQHILEDYNNKILESYNQYDFSFNISKHFLNYFENANQDNLNNEDLKQLKNFMIDKQYMTYNSVYIDSEDFRQCKITNLSSDCVEMFFNKK